MKEINVIIIEDIREDSRHLALLLQKNFPEIHVLKICHSLVEGVKEVTDLKPELIFLDISLSPGTGFDLLEQTRSLNYKVIFTTSFNEYGIKAIKFSALDYILKPYGLEELTEAIDKYKSVSSVAAINNKDILLDNMKQIDPAKQIVGIAEKGGYIFLPVVDIIYCEADKNYTNFILTDHRKINCAKTLKEIEKLMDGHDFFRTHESYLINMAYIQKFKHEGDGGIIELTENNTAYVSRRNKDAFLENLIKKKVIIRK